MSSKSRYAVATLALTVSLPLGACSQAGPTGGEAKPKASATAYAPPAFKVTHEQLRAVMMVGQRFTDHANGGPIHDEAAYVGFCDNGYVGAKGRSWYSNSEAIEPADGVPESIAGNNSTQIGWTFTSTTVLDDSPSARSVVDDRIRGWSTCQPKDDVPLATQKVALPGAGASVVRIQTRQETSPWNAHSASGVARVENALLSCTVSARTAKLALATVTSCLTEMVQAVPMAAEQDVKVTDANRVVATKMLLARTATAGQTATVRTQGSATTPCATSQKTFLSSTATYGLIQTDYPLEGVEDPETAGPQVLGLLTAERLDDAAAARAMVAAARKTFSGCTGSYSKGRAPYVQKGEVTGVADVAFGDGGFTITSTSQFTGQKNVETVQKSIFSAGPYVVEMMATTPKNAGAIAARLKEVAGS